MSTPPFKVFDADGKYQASCKEPEAAAASCAFYGYGARVRYRRTSGPVIFTNGPMYDAADSYDDAVDVMITEIELLHPEFHT